MHTLFINSRIDDVWTPLTQLLQIVRPNKVHINIDPVWAFSDGLHTGIGQIVTSLLGFPFPCNSHVAKTVFKFLMNTTIDLQSI